MFAQKVLQKLGISPHVPNTNSIVNSLTFLCSTTYAIFMTGTILHSVKAPSILTSASGDTVFKQDNVNLTSKQRELLLWQYWLGYINIKHVQFLWQKPCSREPHIIIPSNNTGFHTHQPMCAIYQYAKHKQNNPPKNTTALPLIPTIGGLSYNITKPGQRVYVDLYVATTPGCLPNTFGKESVES